MDVRVDHKEAWVPLCWKTDAYKLWCWRRFLKGPLDCKIKPVNPKGSQPWTFIGRTDDEAEAPILWPSDAKSWLWERPWCWERLKAGGEGSDRGWNDWMTSPTRWTWVWASFRSWWWIGKPAMLQSMGSRESDMTEQLNWTGFGPAKKFFFSF